MSCVLLDFLVGKRDRKALKEVPLPSELLSAVIGGICPILRVSAEETRRLHEIRLVSCDFAQTGVRGRQLEADICSSDT